MTKNQRQECLNFKKELEICMDTCMWSYIYMTFVYPVNLL